MTKKVVLIVDDEPVNINIVANILNNLYDIKIATNGKDALNLLKNEHIDLILLDVIMPEMDGYALSKEISRNPKISNIPYIFITAMNDPKSIEVGFQHGAVDYISKPFYKEELLSRVNTHIKVKILQNTLSETIHELNEHISEVNQTKKEFETIFNYSKDGIAIIDLESNFLKSNFAYLELTKYTEEELLATSYLELTAPEDIDRSKKMMESVITTGSMTNFEKTYILKDNQRVRVNCSISLLPDQERLLIVAKDVTKLKNMEEQARLSSMGEMISNIAHQWRQPLSVISTAASGTKMQHELDILDADELGKNMDMIVQESQYLSKTIDDFKDFIKGTENFKNCSLNGIIDQTVQLMNATLKNNFITLIVELDEDMQILANKGQVIQALVNIINNAKDALLEQNLDDKYIFIQTKALDKDTIELEIVDNAKGIDEKVIDRIFEPYFTTKHQSVGTGIGLNMTRKILYETHSYPFNAYNKEFTYNDLKYYGACFSIKFKKV